MDDIWLCAFVADRVQKEVGGDDILVSHWDGEGAVIPLIEEVLNGEKNLIGDKGDLIFGYIGYERQ